MQNSFKIGDRITVIDTSKAIGCSVIDRVKTGEVDHFLVLDVNADGQITNWLALNKEGKKVSTFCCRLTAITNLKLKAESGSAPGIMTKISNLAKRLLDAETQVFIEAGLLNKDLSLTDDGVRFVIEDYFETNKKALAGKAKMQLDEAKAEAKK